MAGADRGRFGTGGPSFVRDGAPWTAISDKDLVQQGRQLLNMDSDESHSEMEDDLLHETPTFRGKMYLSSSDVLADRLKKQELFEKFDDICQSMKSMETSSETSSVKDLENDEDTKVVLEQAEEMKVQSSTLYYLTDYEFLKPELCGCIFNHETLLLKSFMGDCYSALLCKIRKPDNLQYLVKSTGLQIIPFPKNVTERLCCYLFYVMSVHPDFELVFGCQTYLVKQDYKPKFSDIVNVLCNWGASPCEMFQTTSSTFQGLHPALLDGSPGSPIKIQNFNVLLLLRYLVGIIKTKSPVSYANLLRPMLLFSVNARTYLTITKVYVCDIVRCLANMKVCDYSLENLHLKNLSLRDQYFLCTKSLACTVFQLPLAYATLQQFLGDSVIKYTTDVDLQDVFNLVITKRNNVIRETLNDTSHILKLIDLLVWRTIRFSTNENTQQYVEKWLGLLGDLSLDIQESSRLSDPVLLKEQIAQMAYELRINQPDSHSLSVCKVDM